MAICAKRTARLGSGTAWEPLSTKNRIAASFIEAYFSNYMEGTRFVVDFWLDGAIRQRHQSRCAQADRSTSRTRSTASSTATRFGLRQGWLALPDCEATALYVGNTYSMSTHGKCEDPFLLSPLRVARIDIESWLRKLECRYRVVLTAYTCGS